MSENPGYNAQLRTTCVATMLEGGHAINALPQLATAKVNCRILPGEPVEGVQATIERVLADKQIEVTPTGKAVLSPPSPLNEEIMGSVEKLSKEFWPNAGPANGFRSRRRGKTQPWNDHILTPE